MRINFVRNIGFILLGIWLILTGLIAFIPALGAIGPLRAVLAIAAGIFILIGR